MISTNSFALPLTCQSQAALLKRLAGPESKAWRHSLVQQPTDLLMKIVTITQFYEQKVTHLKPEQPKMHYVLFHEKLRLTACTD